MRRVATLRVTFGDTDAMGVVYYANYLRYFESARAELLRSLGAAYGELTDVGVHLPVAEASVRYMASARYDDLIDLHCAVAALGRASIVFDYRIARPEGTVLAEGRTVHAFTDGTGRIVRIPASFLERTRFGIHHPTEGE